MASNKKCTEWQRHQNWATLHYSQSIKGMLGLILETKAVLRLVNYFLFWCCEINSSYAVLMLQSNLAGMGAFRVELAVSSLSKICQYIFFCAVLSNLYLHCFPILPLMVTLLIHQEILTALNQALLNVKDSVWDLNCLKLNMLSCLGSRMVTAYTTMAAWSQ